MNVPTGSRYVVVNLQNADHKRVLDAILDGKTDMKIPLNNVLVDAKDLKIISKDFQWPYLFIIVAVREGADIQDRAEDTQPAAASAPKSPTSPETTGDSSYEERDKKVKEAMQAEADRDIKAKPAPGEDK